MFHETKRLSLYVETTLYGRCYEVKMLKRRPYNIHTTVVLMGSCFLFLVLHTLLIEERFFSISTELHFKVNIIHPNIIS